VVRPYTDMLPGMQIGAYVMTSDRIQEDPDLVSKYQAGVQATAEAVTADPEAFRASLPKLGNVSEELAPKINLARFHGTTDRESVEQIKQAMLDYGLIDKDLKYEDIVAG
jgi:NitT/TauT family transport system substrate-binding protein